MVSVQLFYIMAPFGGILFQWHLHLNRQWLSPQVLSRRGNEPKPPYKIYPWQLR